MSFEKSCPDGFALLSKLILTIAVKRKVVLRPVAQPYGQVLTDWNQCFVIDCSLRHSAGHKPFTCSHSVLRNT